MGWDYFLSYSSEEKWTADPLARYLDALGFSVWYDDFELLAGDSIVAGINRGLAESKFGILVLSKSFLSRRWTNAEMAGLMMSATGEGRRILPVWHHLDAATIASRVPMLADLKGVSTSRGLHVVAVEIVRASFPDRLTTAPITSTFREAVDLVDARAALRDLLASGGRHEDIRALVTAYPVLVGEPHRNRPAGGVFSASMVGFAPPFDFVIIKPEGVTGPVGMELVVLGPLADDGDIAGFIARTDESLGAVVPFSGRSRNDYLPGRQVGEFPDVLRAARVFAGLIDGGNLHIKTPEVWRFSLHVIHGRRSVNDAVHAARNEAASGRRLPVKISSYDRLTDL